MAPRLARHQRIGELIASREIRTQAELRALLEDDGISVTQATLSRDLTELGVAKSPRGYVIAGVEAGPDVPQDVMWKAIRRELISADYGGTTIVLRTRPGHADALAIEIDRARPAEILGTIAGDDTIFIAARSPRDAEALTERMRSADDHAYRPTRPARRRGGAA